MTRGGERPSESQRPVALPADRWVGALRIALFLPAGLFLLWLTWQNLPALDFRGARLGNRISNYSWGFVWLWVALCGLALFAVAMRWLAYAAWPGWLGLQVWPDRVLIALGPFGRRTLDPARMKAVYRHELDDEDALRSTEDFMLPQEEIERRLPLLTHPELEGSLNRLMERFLTGDERTRLAALRPWVARLRCDPPP